MTASPTVRSTFQEMVEEGLLVPNGQMRPDRNGELQPVYVLSDLAKQLYRQGKLDLENAKG